MYCPICSAIVASNQKFCRTCGFGLEKTVLAVSEQLPSELGENLRDRKNKLERLGVVALSIFGTGLLGLLLYLVGNKLMLSQGKIVAALGILAFIVIMGSGLLSVILFAKANEVKEESGKRRLRKPENLTGSQGTEKLLPHGQRTPMASVTERTTELLGVEAKGAPRE